MDNAWIFSPECSHGWSTPSGCEAEVAVVHFEDVPNVVQAALSHRPYLGLQLNPDTLEQCRTITQNILDCIGRAEALNALKYQKHQAELFLELFKQLHFPSPLHRDSPQRIAEKALSWLQANLEQNPHLEDAARYCCLSMTHLRRIFHEGLGKSPVQALGELKLARACELLRDTALGLEQIACASGYSNASNLTRIFRQKKGVPPGVWRREFNRSEYTPTQA
jgi:AraC-like DNA-binding protein